MSHVSAARTENWNLRALFIAPLVLPILVVAVQLFVVDGAIDPYRWSVMGVLWELSILGFSYLISLIGFVVFGLPAIVILSRINRLKIWTLVVAGLAQGVLVYCLFHLLPPVVTIAHGETVVKPDFNVSLAGGFGLFGALYAAVYGIAAKIRFR